MEDQFRISRFFRNRSERDPDMVAVYDYDNRIRYTYKELLDRASSVAVFQLEHGIKKGDRVAIFAKNSIESMDILYSLQYTGAILTTYNFRLRAEELVGLLTSESPAMLFYDAAFSEKIEVIRSSLPDTFFVSLNDNNQFGDVCYSEALDAPGSKIPCVVNMEDILMLCHTGGTTGVPKAAMISYHSLIYNTMSQIVEYGISSVDVMYVSYPLFHISAWSAALSMLQAGGRIIFKKDFDTEETLKLLEKEKLTILNGSPTVYQRMCLSPRFDKTDFSSVRFVRCGAAPPSAELVNAYLKKGLKFINAYGMTESGTSVLSMPLGSADIDTIRKKAGSAGKPMLFTSLRIIDDNGMDVRDGESGELLVKNEMLFSGYWNNEAETQNVMDGCWLHTGDMARCDDEGYYYICGRKKHMFISHGENIFPVEIENFLYTIKDIDDCYVFGVPDMERGEAGKAIIVLHPGSRLTAEDILAEMKGKLSTLKIPKYIEFVPKVPRNDVGKVCIHDVIRLYGLKK